MINNEFVELGYDSTGDDGVSIFNYKSEDGTDCKLGFSLKKYNPAIGKDDYLYSDNSPSGAYLFKPSRGDKKQAYSTFKSTNSY